MIEFNCPFCSRKMKAPDEYAGKQGTCNSCKHFVIVPRPDSSRVLPSIPAPKRRRLRISYRVFSRVVYATIAVGLIGLFLWKYFGTYSETSNSIAGISVTDVYWNWNHQPHFRYVVSKTKSGELVVTAEGPTSSSGRSHGQWNMFDWTTSTSSNKWFWYGEEITEGEWHLRNK